MTPKNTIRVLIAEDETIVRECLIALFEQQEDLKVVGAAANGREAVEQFRLYQPDVALLDLGMPVMDGLEAIRQIRKEFPSARLLVITMYAGDEHIYQALHLGAKGYLLKSAPVTELMAAIHAVYTGTTYLPSEIVASLTENLPHPMLTTREQEVLNLLARGNNNQRMADTLFVSVGTIKSHLIHLREKLGAHDRTHAVSMALQRGFVKAWDL